MNYLAHELALLQAEAQRYDAQAAQLNASAAQQDQVAAAARTRAANARSEANRLNGEAASFDSQAAASDAQANDLDRRISQELAAQPERTMENPNPRGKPPFIPNPLYAPWKRNYDSLVAQRDQARAAAASQRTDAGQRRASAAQSQAAANAADNEAAAAAAAAQLRQQAAQAVAQRDGVNQRMAPVVRWQQEIARQQPDRGALESAERELTARLDQLEGQYSAALDAWAAADRRQWYLTTLTQELNAKINNLNAQLTQATADQTGAAAQVADLQRRIDNVMMRRPE